MSRAVCILPNAICVTFLLCLYYRLVRILFTLKIFEECLALAANCICKIPCTRWVRSTARALSCRKKSQDMNLGQLGEKHERFLVLCTPPIFILKVNLTVYWTTYVGRNKLQNCSEKILFLHWRFQFRKSLKSDNSIFEIVKYANASWQEIFANYGRKLAIRGLCLARWCI